MKLLYQGAMWRGATTRQRADAFARCPGVTVIPLDTGAELGKDATLYSRVRWKLRWPVDTLEENRRLLEVAARERPDAVIVDNSKVINRATLRSLRKLGVRCLAYYTPDDVMGAHNLSWPLRMTFPEWDVFFTTKTFNVPELAAHGVRRPVLIGKSFDPDLHRPLAPEEVGEGYEEFDAVFIGTFERQRCQSINALAENGIRVVVYGGSIGGWPEGVLHSSICRREAVFGDDYTECMHHGRLALCFLRKLNRDRITQRTMEIAAMGRPMLAERTDEHEAHFIDGQEYVAFSSDCELISRTRDLLADEARRVAVGAAGRARCIHSGYSSASRATAMIDAMRESLDARTTARMK